MFAAQVIWPGGDIHPPFGNDLLVSEPAAIEIDLPEQGHIQGDERQVVASLVNTLRIYFPTVDSHAQWIEQVTGSKFPGAHPGRGG